MLTKVMSPAVGEQPTPKTIEDHLATQWLTAVNLLVQHPLYAFYHITIGRSTINGTQWEARLGGLLLAWAPNRAGLFAILSYIFLLASQCSPDDEAKELSA